MSGVRLCVVFSAIVVGGVYSGAHGQSSGTFVAWGDNQSGQCGIPEPDWGFVAVTGGASHTLGLRADRSIWTEGLNNYGQCDVPAPNEGFVAVAAGSRHSLGLKANGSIVTWGRDNDGQCDVPPPNADFTAISARANISMAVRSDGSLAVWGYPGFGQLVIPPPNAGFVAVAAGYMHGLGLKADGSVVAWGNNSYHQCEVPAPNAGFFAIAAGSTYSLAPGRMGPWRPGATTTAANAMCRSARTSSPSRPGISTAWRLTAAGKILAWGRSSEGQTKVPKPNAGFVTLGAGGQHSLGLRQSGCPADCDASGDLDLFDYLCFLDRYSVGDADADCTADESLDLFDYLCFVNAFNAGC